MSENAFTSLTVDEISKMLVGEWGKKDVESISINDLNSEQIEDLEDPYVRAEEEYISHDINAKKAAPLKNYYLNSSPETLLQVKSRLGKGIVPEFSYLATIYLMQMLEGVERNKLQEAAYQTVILQERIRSTPDEIWEDALRKNAEELKDVTNAPDIDDFGFPQYICHCGTIKIEGDVDEFLQDCIKEYNEDTERIANSLITFGIYEILGWNTTTYLGINIAEQKHLMEKGLDGFINSSMPYAFQRTDKDGNAYLMRFFVVKEKVDDWISGAHKVGESDTSSNRSANKYMYVWSRGWNEYLLAHGLRITQIEERIEPIQTCGGYLDVTAKLNCGYVFSDRSTVNPLLEEGV